MGAPPRVFFLTLREPRGDMASSTDVARLIKETRARKLHGISPYVTPDVKCLTYLIPNLRAAYQFTVSRTKRGMG